jgi:ribosomal protein RSM22 (predicted rRNA methylase)
MHARDHTHARESARSGAAPPPVGEVLRAALAALLDGLPPRQAGRAVERLIAGYRGSAPEGIPVLRDRSEVAAYAAYRMPATFESVRSALAAFHELLPHWAPASHVDIGGGTGAALWAAAAVWAEQPRSTTVLDRAQPALDLGRELARGSGLEPLRGAEWRRQVIGGGLLLPAADLVTASYVLGELSEADRRAVVGEAARSARAVVLVEPGTPSGFERIRVAREQLAASGLRVVAPCPHSGPCPIVSSTEGSPAGAGGEWCHFAARVSRSSLHRRVKGGSLPYEDEKFSYAAAVRADAPTAPSRILRHPQLRKGQVLLELCAGERGLHRETVSKRHGPLYRAARAADWGDTWPPDSGRGRD